MNIALWVLQILFAALFMLHAVLHLFPSPRLKEILAEQNIPVKRMIANWAEVAASLGLILPGAVSIATGLTRGRRGRDKRRASRAKRGGGWYHAKRRRPRGNRGERARARPRVTACPRGVWAVQAAR